MPSEPICPQCRVERADYEGPGGQWLPRCPNCGADADPVIREYTSGSEIAGYIRQAIEAGPDIMKRECAIKNVELAIERLLDDVHASIPQEIDDLV